MRVLLLVLLTGCATSGDIDRLNQRIDYLSNERINQWQTITYLQKQLCETNRILCPEVLAARERNPRNTYPYNCSCKE